MLTCRELAQLQASDYLEHQLTLRQRVGFRIHLLLCNHCRRFMRQFRMIGQVISRQPVIVDEATVLTLADRLHRAHRQHHNH